MSDWRKYFEIPDEETLGKLDQHDLSILIGINENHMCHVESEKLGIIKIYVAVVSIVMAVVFLEGIPKVVKIALLVFLLILGSIVYALSVRWSHVFDNHKKILSSLLEQVLRNSGIDLETEKKSSLNRYFLFDNKKYSFKDKMYDLLKLPKKKDRIYYRLKTGHIQLNDDGTYHYVSTGKLISAFVAVSLLFVVTTLIAVVVLL